MSSAPAAAIINIATVRTVHRRGKSMRRRTGQNGTLEERNGAWRDLGLERGGMHGFRHHRVSTLVMAGTPMVVIKKWIGRGSEEMVNRYTHLRPDFMQSELERVPDFVAKNAEFDPIDPQAEVAA